MRGILKSSAVLVTREGTSFLTVYCCPVAAAHGLALAQTAIAVKAAIAHPGTRSPPIIGGAPFGGWAASASEAPGFADPPHGGGAFVVGAAITRSIRLGYRRP